MDVATLLSDATADQRARDLGGSEEPRLLRALGDAIALLRQVELTYFSNDKFTREQLITLNGSAWYTAVNLGRLVHVEIKDTWEIVSECAAFDRAQGYRGTYPTGQDIRIHYVPQWPALLQGTASGGSATYIDLPNDSEGEIECGEVETRDNAYAGTLIETLYGTGAGQVLLVTASVGSTGRCTVTLEDGSTAQALGSDTEFCTYLGDMDRLIRWAIVDVALTMITGKQVKADIMEAKLRSVLSLLGVHPNLPVQSTEDTCEESGLYYRRSGARLQFLGVYGNALGLPWSGLLE